MVGTMMNPVIAPKDEGQILALADVLTDPAKVKAEVEALRQHREAANAAVAEANQALAALDEREAALETREAELTARETRSDEVIANRLAGVAEREAAIGGKEAAATAREVEAEAREAEAIQARAKGVPDGVYYLMLGNDKAASVWVTKGGELVELPEARIRDVCHLPNFHKAVTQARKTRQMGVKVGDEVSERTLLP